MAEFAGQDRPAASRRQPPMQPPLLGEASLWSHRHHGGLHSGCHGCVSRVLTPRKGGTADTAVALDVRYGQRAANRRHPRPRDELIPALRRGNLHEAVAAALFRGLDRPSAAAVPRLARPAGPRPGTVSSGTIGVTPSSTAFSTSHFCRSPLGRATPRISMRGSSRSTWCGQGCQLDLRLADALDLGRKLAAAAVEQRDAAPAPPHHMDQMMGLRPGQRRRGRR